MKKDCANTLVVNKERIIAIPTREDKVRKWAYWCFYLLYFSVACAIWVFVEHSVQQTKLLGGLMLGSLLFVLVYPRKNPTQTIRVKGNRIERTHVSFPTKSSFEFTHINEVLLVREDTGMKVEISYGVESMRFELMDSLSERDGKTVREWMKMKVADS